MAKKTDSDNDNGIIRQFNELKKKHPDAMLLFRRNSFYELYKQDAVKAAAVLAIKITDRMLPDYKRPVKVASFPQSALAFSVNHLGPHGLPAGLYADWNDCLRLGKNGESSFVALQFYYAMTILKQFADKKRFKFIKRR